MMWIFGDSVKEDAAFAERLRACGLDRVDSVLSRVEGQIVAWSRTTDTILVRPSADHPGFFVKRYRYPGWRKRWRGMFRGTFFGVPRAVLEYRALRALQLSGVSAVRPVAVGTRRLARFVTVCYLVTEEVPGAQNLTQYAIDVREGRIALSRPERRRIVTTLALVIAALHREGRSHGQLYLRNILIRHGPGAVPEFFFLDVQPIPRIERVSSGVAWWIRELAQLAASSEMFVSRGEVAAFFRTYFGARRLDSQRHAQIRDVARLMAEHRKHEAQRVRMSQRFGAWSRKLDAEQAGGAPTA